MITRREFLLTPAASWFKSSEIKQIQRDIADLKMSLSKLWATIEQSARNTNTNNATFVEHIAKLDERVREIERVMERKLI